MINQILSQLGANTKITVGVSVSPSIGLEMAEIDRASKTVMKYACRPLEYDFTKREIADYNKFAEALTELFEELKISKKTNIVLTVPSVHYGLVSLPVILGESGLSTALVSDAEQSSYIFKRSEPVASWADILSPNSSEKENRDIVYSAIQQEALDNIKSACSDVGCNLLAIEVSYNSLLKALAFTDIAHDQMTTNAIWNLMIVNQNSYAFLTLSGKNIIEFKEEPLALKSFVGEEIYNAIISSSQIYTQTTSAASLYVISETDLVSAEVLSMKLPFAGEIKFIESNKYVSESIVKSSYSILPNLAMKISPSIVGSAIYQFSDYPIKFNLAGQVAPSLIQEEVAPKINIGGLEVELTSTFLKRIFGIIATIFFIPAAILFGLSFYFDTKESEELEATKLQIAKVEAELKAYEGDRAGGFDEYIEKKSIQAKNKLKLLYYTAIAVNLPQNTWLYYLHITPSGNVDILGRSQNVENIYLFYRGLKASIIDSNLKLHKLELMSNDVASIVANNSGEKSPLYYEFEITNCTEGELGEIAESEDKKSADDKSADDKSGKKSKADGSPNVKDEAIDAANVGAKRGTLTRDWLNGSNSGDEDLNSLIDDTPASPSIPTSSRGNSSGKKPPKNLPANLDAIESF